MSVALTTLIAINTAKMVALSSKRSESAIRNLSGDLLVEWSGGDGRDDGNE
jgi:hypothetical protein